MKSVRGFIILILSGFSFIICAQQDAPLSYVYDVSVLVNPALVGLGGELYGDIHSRDIFRLNYKNQIADAFTYYSVKTASLSYEHLFAKERMGLGFNVYSNTYGRNAFRDLAVMASYAYHVTLAKNANSVTHRISLGLSAGYRNLAYDFDDIQTGSMYDPRYVGGFDPSERPIFDNSYNQAHVFDINVGAVYTGKVSDMCILKAGVAASHIFNSETDFMEEGSRRPIKAIAFVESSFRFGGVKTYGNNLQTGEKIRYSVNNTSISPYSAPRNFSELSTSILYVYQDFNNTLELAVSYKFHFSSVYSLGVGLAYRTETVVIPAILTDFARFSLAISFEYHTTANYNNMVALGLGYRF